MSFGKDENNEVHEPNTRFNKNVVETIGIVKNADSVSGCINDLTRRVTLSERREEIDTERLSARKEWTKSEIGTAQEEMER